MLANRVPEIGQLIVWSSHGYKMRNFSAITLFYVINVLRNI